MDHLGHGLALQHPIFNTPHKARFEWIEKPRPKHYEGFTSPLHPEGVGETLRYAPFETSKPAGHNPTIVAHEGYFTDVPGFECLAEGNSAKVLGSLSLARQGNVFYWGYSVDPGRMTEGAQDTLVNVLHYMVGKRGAKTVPFSGRTRKILHTYTWLGADREKPYLRGVQEHLPNSLVPAAKKTYTAKDHAGAKAWTERYLPYVYSGKGEQHRHARYKNLFDIDTDAMALGTPNNKPASLQRWIHLLADGEAEQQAQAQRCLDRYVHPDIRPKPGESWPEWWTRNSEELVFVDSAGFWWMRHPGREPAEENTATDDTAAKRAAKK